MRRSIDDVEDVGWDDWGTPRSRKPRRRRILVIAAVVLALLLACTGGLTLRAYAAGQALGPLDAARAYCAALTGQRYPAAYALLAARARGGATAAAWAADAQLHDTVDGRASRCVAAAPSRGALGDFSDSLGIAFGALTTVPISVTLTRGHLGQRAGTLWLARQSGKSGAWQISTMPDTLQGTPLGPLKTVQAFCQALAAGNFTQAYTYLSARQMALAKSAAAFAQQVTPPAGTKYTGCAPDDTTYKTQPAAASMALALSIAVTTAAGTSTVPVHGVASLVLEHGAWKLDGLDLGTLSS
ncbi:MAG TPA: hypothetical protein VIG30_13185 [Ktedonobacterales bacterium]